MTVIYATTNDLVLAATRLPRVSCNNQNSVKLHVDFDASWSEYAKSAVFYTSKDHTVYEVILSTNGECLVPAEVLVEEGTLYIGVRGVKTASREVKSSTLVKYKVLPGTPSMVIGDPTPSLYQQLLEAYILEKTRLDNLMANIGTSYDAELIDLRVGADTFKYITAGEAVREQMKRAVGTYVYQPEDYIGNRWIDDSGKEYDDTNYNTTPIIDLTDCTAIQFRLYQYNNSSTNTRLAMIAYFDENLNFIEAITKIADQNSIVEATVIPPETAKFAIGCMYRPAENLFVKFYYSTYNYIAANGTEKVVDLCEAPTSKGYIRTDDVVISDENWVHTDYIPVIAGRTLKLGMHGHTSVNSVSFYNSSKTLLSGIIADISYLYGGTEKLKYGTVVIPSEAAYVRLSYRTNCTTRNSCKYKIDIFGDLLGEAEKTKQLERKVAALQQTSDKPLRGKTIFLAGDSRSSTDYSFYREALNEKSGADIIVGGASGWSTAQIASNTYFERLKNYPHDFSIWLVGGNDIGAPGTIGTFSANSLNGQNGESVVSETDISADYSGNTFIQAVDHIMRKYKSMFYDWKTLNNGQKPKMIFCTDIPQKRSGGDSTWSLKDNWLRKRNAIVECCEKNNIAMLDLYGLCNFDMSYEPEWTSPTDKVNNNGLYFMDGLHPNKYGIDIITSLELEEIKKHLTIY